MAKTKIVKKHNKIDLDNLSERDKDILTLDVQEAMKKYKVEKQGVYDRRFALNKKIREAGLTADQVLNGKTPSKRGRPKKEVQNVEPVTESRALMIIPEKNVPVVMKPIEINFDNFSIKLNGVPKRISINPETNAIEIDL
ncbi:MAG: hypothetical protein JWQ96_716 [Segetibacter sp.]|nr:hypothetical protein [Segetibacter sp.]